MIELKDVNFKYKNGKEVLKNINLQISEGEFVSIIGKNGSGKSTLAKLISGLEKPKKGTVLVDELDTKERANFQELRKKVGIVFQNPENQILFNNVYDDIAFAINNLKLNDIEIRIEQALEKVVMKEFIKSNTYELSLGQKQRVTIAGVLAINSKYIIFDESTTMLDSYGKETFYKILRTLKEQGYTIIYITNAIDEILMADRIVLIKKGEIVSQFKKEDILENIDVLKSNSIEIPYLVNFVEKLNINGIEVELEKWTKEELIEKVIEVYKKWKIY